MLTHPDQAEPGARSTGDPTPAVSGGMGPAGLCLSHWLGSVCLLDDGTVCWCAFATGVVGDHDEWCRA